MKTTSPQSSSLMAYALNRLIVSILFAAFGSFAVQSNRRRQERLAEVLGALLQRAPIAFLSADSAAASLQYKPAEAHHDDGNAQGLVPIIYEPRTVSDLIAAAEFNIGTRSIARKLSCIPAKAQKVSSKGGCAGEPIWGAGSLLTSFADYLQALENGLRRTHDSGLIHECRQAGFNVRASEEIPIVTTVNLAAGTGSQAIMFHGVASRVTARDLGYRTRSILIGLLPSCSTATDPEAARQVAGGTLLTLCRGQEAPETLAFSTFQGRRFEWSESPIFDEIFLVAAGSELRAASNRDVLAEHLANLAVAQVCTDYLARAQAAFIDGIPGQAEAKHGLPLVSRFGLARLHSNAARNRAVGVNAAAQHIAQSI